MKGLIERYKKFLTSFARADMDVLVIFFALTLLMGSLLIGFASIREGDFLIPFLGVVVLPTITFLAIALLIFPLIIVYKNIAVENELNKIIVDCLNELGIIKETMEFNQVYHLSKGTSVCRTDLLKAEAILKNALGAGYQVRVECHDQLTQYRIELVRYPELEPLLEEGPRNLLIET